MSEKRITSASTSVVGLTDSPRQSQKANWKAKMMEMKHARKPAHTARLTEMLPKKGVTTKLMALPYKHRNVRQGSPHMVCHPKGGSEEVLTIRAKAKVMPNAVPNWFLSNHLPQ